MVTAHQESRTAGVMYTVRDRKLYFSTHTSAWKTRHITANPHVSATIPIAKRIPVMPWIKIPAATITISGTARVFPASEVSPDLLVARPGSHPGYSSRSWSPIFSIESKSMRLSIRGRTIV